MATATLSETSVLDLRSRVAQRPYWYHRIELPGEVVTPGWAPISKVSYCIPEDLTGKRVLDIGAWDGFWTFEALKRGAREVVAIDDFSDFLGSLRTADRTGWENFDLCREAFGYSSEICDRREMSVYDISEEKLGRFDVVFFFGTLYHLRHPLLALDRISSVCDSELYVESAILDDYSPYRGGLGQGYAGGQMVMEFYPETQYGNNASNWWVPTLHCLAFMMKAAGFANSTGWKLTLEAPTVLAHCRGFAKGVKTR
jgi:tRNA (mo5U34)-methyltransferase